MIPVNPTLRAKPVPSTCPPIFRRHGDVEPEFLNGDGWRTVADVTAVALGVPELFSTSVMLLTAFFCGLRLPRAVCCGDCERAVLAGELAK